MPGISIVIPTYNEEAVLRDCLESVRWADEILVVDAESPDATARVVAEAGAVLCSFPRDKRDSEKQRLHGIKQARFDWIFCVDADERPSPELVLEIKEVTGATSSKNGFFIPFNHIFFGRHLKHGNLDGRPLLRLFRKGRGGYPLGGLIHEQLAVDGPTGVLRSPMLHYGTRDLTHYYEKTNRYSSLTARKMFNQGRRVTRLNWPSCYLVKPAYYFIKYYFLKAGYRDGIVGLLYALLTAFTVVANHLKLWELQQSLKHGSRT